MRDLDSLQIGLLPDARESQTGLESRGVLSAAHLFTELRVKVDGSVS